MKNLSLVISISIIFTTMAFSKNHSQTDSVSVQTEKQETFRRHSIGSSLWVIYDKLIEEPAGFYQFDYRYHLSQKDVFIVEAITWEYSEPLGTYENSKEMYPGKVRAYGIGVGYQRFLWKNLYTSIIATPFLQQYYDENDKKTQKGFQLYFQLIAGYRFEFFNKCLFVEPACALKLWPINTNIPKSIKEINKGTPGYKFEPSLNFGFRF